MSYNGYKNFETWQVSLWISEYGLGEELSQLTWQGIRERVSEIVYQGIEPTSLTNDLLGAALNSVDWMELQQLYAEDYGTAGSGIQESPAMYLID